MEYKEIKLVWDYGFKSMGKVERYESKKIWVLILVYFDY